MLANDVSPAASSPVLSSFAELSGLVGVVGVVGEVGELLDGRLAPVEFDACELDELLELPPPPKMRMPPTMRPTTASRPMTPPTIRTVLPPFFFGLGSSSSRILFFLAPGLTFESPLARASGFPV